MSKVQQYRQRLEALFNDIERLSTDPARDTKAILREIQDLRARMYELESDLRELEERAESHESPQLSPTPPPVEGTRRSSSAPIVYEKDFVGYLFTGDRVQPLQASLTPKVEADLTAPLLVSGQPIGRVQVSTPLDHEPTPEEVSLFNAVAQRASQQIENLRLLSEAERARAEAESATRRYMHEHWDSFMDAIHQSERVGYAYDQASVKPFLEKTSSEDAIVETVKVMEEQVGAIYVKPDPSRPLGEHDKEMIAAIANRVAQQVENIRLLADAARARAEAEEATRRLARESWETFAVKRSANIGYVYDANEVISLGDAPLLKNMDFTQSLTVRGEPIGRLAVSGGKNLTREDADLIAAIAERVGAQLETLRLTEELQKRAAELESVAKLSTTASTAPNPDELLQSVVDMTKDSFNLYHAHIYLANESWNTLLLAAGAGEVGRAMVDEHHAIPMDAEKSLAARASREHIAQIANDVQAETDFLPNPLLPNTRSEMAVPMIVGGKAIGVFDVQSDQAGRFSEEDANIFTTLASQVAVALQNARLYTEQTATVIQLRELDRLKSSFLANMSHELRTPLNSILGFADVMLEELDGPLTENMNTDLKLIQKNGQHLLHLINDVLDMAKIESGRMNLHPEKFFLQELFEEVTGLTSSLASERNISLFIDPASDALIEVNADRTRLRQVMLNLVNNAIKFTERGKISIHAEQRNDTAHITVRDTGIGIPPDQLESIFQEFTQVDTTTTRKAGGTGLGLPISRRLVEMHGGQLWAESAGIPGEGSILHVELPLDARIADAEKVEK
jgi:signal transduction histidine kinase